MLQNMATNWKTTLAGVLVIAMGGLSLIGIHVPGFTDPGFSADLTIGVGLIVASDQAATTPKA